MAEELPDGCTLGLRQLYESYWRNSKCSCDNKETCALCKNMSALRYQLPHIYARVVKIKNKQGCNNA